MYVSLESCICSCFMVMNKAGMGRRERRRFVEEIDKTGSRKKMRSRRRLSIMNFNKDETTFIERERTSWEICMPNLELTHSGSNSVSTNELSFYIHHHWSVIVVVVHHIKSHPFLIVITCYWHPYIHRQPTHTGIYACMSPTNIFNHVSCCGITCLFINHSSRFSRCDKVTTNTLSSPSFYSIDEYRHSEYCLQLVLLNLPYPSNPLSSFPEPLKHLDFVFLSSLLFSDLKFKNGNKSTLPRFSVYATVVY